MTFCYSEPFESLIQEKGSPGPVLRARVVIVGSGYGGSIAAYRLAGRRSESAPPRDAQVIVLERGREYSLGEFPNTLGELPGHLAVRRHDRPDADGNEDALFNFHLGEGVDVLVGSGLGGTSLINANVALRPPASVFQSGAWPKEIASESAAPKSALDDAYTRVSELLEVASELQREQLKDLSKYKALASVAKALGASTRTAPITVTLPGAPRTNAAGVAQSPCTFCGNCVTGCNVGAKNTLTMNAIPRAYALGARFYTGARVIRVMPTNRGGDAPRWEVHVEATSRATRARCTQTFVIEADTVVLSAGTLGSTEILQRSALEGAGDFSPTLGDRFSTNGDAIAMSFGEDTPVSALGTQDYDSKHQCGPTITAVATPEIGGDARGPRQPFTLEDGAVPSSIVRLYSELLTTSAQIGRWGKNRLPAALAGGGDPLAVDPAVIDRGQVLLFMGPDGTRGLHAARGRLQFQSDWDGPDSGFTVPMWTPGTLGPSVPLTQLDEILTEQDREAGLRGGQYVPNPMWRVVPEAASSVMSGMFPGGRMITVHPLGGCAMSDSGLTGVVNHNGQVFRGTSADCHAGLYVLDGAIVPASLGVNPFLTISALSWRASDAIAKELNEVSAGVTQRPLPQLPVPLEKRTEPLTDAIVVRERLVGRLENVTGELPASQFPGWERWKDECGLILQVESEGSSTDDLLSTRKPVNVRVRLYTNPVDAQRVRRLKLDGVQDEDLVPGNLAAEGEGTVTFMQAAVPSGTLQRWLRTFAAFWAYLKRRQSLLSLIFDQGGKKTDSKQSLWEIVKALANVAEMHATYRDFDYQLSLRPVAAGGGTAPVLRFTGRKRLAWTVSNPRLWQSLLEIASDVNAPELGFKARARLRVDMRFLLGSGLISAASGASVPGAIAACGSLIARFARCMLQSSFWEFGSPAYPEKPIECKPQLPPTLKDGTPLQTFLFNVPKKQAGGSTLVLKLHRYGDGTGTPVLLIHGLAQGSLIYAHPQLENSMADYFRSKGYDVWLLDYRLSNLFTAAEVPFNGWTIDEIGGFDVPLAVAEVLSHYPASTRLHVFAHCVGAIGVTMAILGNKLDKSRLASVVLNAIHPWTIPSPANAARAKLAVFYRDAVGDEFFDPIIQTEDAVSATQSLQDRLAFSLARLGENEGAHHRKDDEFRSNGICDRMTFLYGRMWRHPNVESVHGSWKDLVGRSPGAVQRHLFYTLIRERVLDHEGLNKYLIDKNLPHWRGIRTLFMHGEESSVFNPQSASRSAFRLDVALNRLAEPGTPPTPIGLRRVPGFGHMDPILAADAASESFRYIHHFFAGDFDSGLNSPEKDGDPALSLDPIVDDGTSLARGEPETGPIMRAARIENGRVLARFWLERPVMSTTTMGSLQVRTAGELEHFGDPKLEPQYEWFDATFDADKPVDPPVTVKPKGSRFARSRAMTDSSIAAIAAGGLEAVSSPIPSEVPSQIPSWQRRLVERSQGASPDDCYFVVASCLYTGTPFDRDLGAGVFNGMQKMLTDDVDCDLLFFVGDQIYADASAGLLDPVAWRDRYTGRYRDAFNARAVHDVLSSIPCHFAVDDHEFADNYMGTVEATPFSKYASWQEDAPARAIRQGAIDAGQFAFAKQMARSYQSSGRDLRAFGAAPQPPPETLWYALDHDSEIRCPAFVLDTRSERQRATERDPARLMTDAQMSALLDWLNGVRADARPKFIFSGSVIAPQSRGSGREGMWMREDGLAGYPDELGKIVAFIADKGIQRVVFVAGDLHLSCTARLTLEGPHGKVEALQIVSSALYAPLPFANMDSRQIEWGKPAVIAAGAAKIRYEPALLASGRPHFVRVGASKADDGWDIFAEAWGADGMPFADHRFHL